MKLALGIVVVLVAFWGLTLWRAAQREAQAETTHPPQGQIITVDGHKVHALVMGTGPDLVLIHGASGNLRDMSFGLMQELASDFRVIAFDRPGLGYTDPLHAKGASIAEQADLLARAAAQLGATRPVVLGQSYGGAVALAWGVHHPDALAGLVLVSNPAYPWTSPLPRFYRVNSSALGHLAIPLITAWVPDSTISNAMAAVFLPQPEVEGYAAHFGPGLTLRRSSLRANALHRAGLLAQMTELAPHYDQITVPMELVHGDADTTVGAAIHAIPFAQTYPHAHLTLLPGAGHMPHHTHRAEVIAAIHRAHHRATAP